MKNKLGGVWGFITDMVKNGPAGIWKSIKEKIKNLWKTVYKSIKDWIVTRIITEVTIKIAMMLNPAGALMAVVNGFIALFKAVQTLMQQIKAMLEVLGTVADSIVQIAKGNVVKAATFVETALAEALPVAIAFLANQVGLGGLSKRIKEMITKVQAKVNQAIDWLIDKALKLGKSIFNAMKAGVKSVGSRVKNWWKAMRKFTTKDGANHKLYFKGTGKNAKLTIASTPTKFEDFIKDKTVQAGYFSFYHDKSQGKVYLQIDKFEQDFLFQSSLPHGIGSNDIGLDRGQLSDTRLVTFERAGNKVVLKQKPTLYRADSRNRAERKALSQAFATSILWGFEVVDSAKGWVLVDASDFILQDIHGAGRRLEQRKQGSGYKVDKSRSAVSMARTTSFPDNTELEATITLTGKKPGKYLTQVAPDPRAITLKMHHSFVRLPKKGYQFY